MEEESFSDFLANIVERKKRELKEGREASET